MSTTSVALVSLLKSTLQRSFDDLRDAGWSEHKYQTYSGTYGALFDGILDENGNVLHPDENAQVRDLLNAAIALLVAEAVPIGLLAGGLAGGFTALIGAPALAIPVGITVKLVVDAAWAEFIEAGLGWLADYGITPVGAVINYSNSEIPLAIYGTIADDNVTSTIYDDLVVGYGGDDIIKQVGGSDIIYGGKYDVFDLLMQDIDKVEYIVDRSIYVEVVGKKEISVIHSTGQDTLVDIEQVQGTGADDSFLFGDYDSQMSTSADPGFLGMGGDDVFLLNGSGGTADGGEGVDTVQFYDLDLAQGFVDLKQGKAQLGAQGSATASFDVSNVENIIGTNGRDELVGNDEDNEIWGARKRTKSRETAATTGSMVKTATICCMSARKDRWRSIPETICLTAVTGVTSSVI